MGNAALEAMACAVPVVLTPFVGLPQEFGKPGREYLLAEHDPAAIAAAITILLDNRNLRLDIGNNALAWVKQTMDVERSLDRYAALYREIAASRLGK
jgi:glycosyltransferase involved in cell wall biosynthesis